MPRIAPTVRLARRQLLLDAAWRCAATKRFHALTIDDVCTAAGMSKGAFYGYFTSKQDLLLALLDDSAGALDRVLDELAQAPLSSMERVRRFAQAMLHLRDQPGRGQVRADLWADILTDDVVRARFSATMHQRRVRLRGWIEDGIAAGDFVAVPANACASILLALGDGLTLHAELDPAAFRWENIQRVLDVLFVGPQRVEPPTAPMGAPLPVPDHAVPAVPQGGGPQEPRGGAAGT